MMSDTEQNNNWRTRLQDGWQRLPAWIQHPLRWLISPLIWLWHRPGSIRRWAVVDHPLKAISIVWLIACLIALWFWLNPSVIYWWPLKIDFNVQGTPFRDGHFAEDLRNLLWALSFIGGAWGALLVLINALRRTAIMETEQELNRRSADNETFTQALAQLQSGQRDVRLGAIFALEGLMKNDFAQRGSDYSLGKNIGEMLAAYVRKRSWDGDDTSPPSDKTGTDKGVKTETQRSKPDRLAVDIEAAVRVIARSWPYQHRPQLSGEGGVDLSDTNLNHLRLPFGADMRQFDLSRAELNKAQLRQANLLQADLNNANLQGARLGSANLQGANLDNANLQEANLDDANLQEANLDSAKLKGASLWDTNLQGATLLDANLQGARLINANLQGARLGSAKLQGARLNDTVFYSEDEGAAIGLTREQIASAFWFPDSPPILPPGMDLPHNGLG